MAAEGVGGIKVVRGFPEGGATQGLKVWMTWGGRRPFSLFSLSPLLSMQVSSQAGGYEEDIPVL